MKELNIIAVFAIGLVYISRPLLASKITGSIDPSLLVLAKNLLGNPNVMLGLYSVLFIEDLDDSLIKKVLPVIEKAKYNSYDFAGRVCKRMSNKLKRD